MNYFFCSRLLALRQFAPIRRIGLDLKYSVVIQRTLDGIFQVAKGSLRAPNGVKLCSRQNRKLNLHAVEIQTIVSPGANCLLNDLKLRFLELIKGLGLSYLPQGRAVNRERAFTFRDDLRLCLQESRGGFLPASLRLSDGSLISIEERNRRGEADGKETMFLFVRISRPEIDVGILLGDLELQVGFSGRVLRERAPNIQAIQDCFALNFRD